MIYQALLDLGMLQEKKEGLVFACGREPLASLFASMGCNILATDLDMQDERSQAWHKTNQTCTIKSLNERKICENVIFNERVKYMSVDMNKLPPDLGLFDFLWSACSVEHLGSIDLGKQFIINSLDYLKPNGIAVHTLEYNVSSNEITVAVGETVLFRQKDIEDIIEQAEKKGFKIFGIDWDKGNQIFDNYVDLPPYQRSPHLKLQISGFTCTSFLLVLQKM
jgi:2-polyprenyl-3-methyl-5-hydroxy-6-metoxy-1,4-benzoquinol methylase